MTDTVFQDYVTPVPAAWLNDVDAVVYRMLGSSTGPGGAAPTSRQDIINNLAVISSGTLASTNGAGLVGTADGFNLQELLTNSLGHVVTSIAALRAVSKLDYTKVFTSGYYASGDGGGGPYYYDAADTTSADNGGTVIVASDGGRWKLAWPGSISVRQFGAKGDGSTNDTAAIQAADTWCRSVQRRLYFPGAVYMVSQLVFYTGSDWFGDGRAATIIRQIVGSNTDLLYGYNSNANWGSSAPTNIVDGAAFRDLQLDGNWNAGAGNTSGNGISYYGARPILEDIFITNCAGNGIRSEYTDSSAGGTDTFTMEGWLADVRIDTVGQHGWWNNGPHDTIATGVIVVDAGQATTNTYDAFYYDAKSTGRNIGLHAWNRSASKRHRYALNLRPGSQHEFTGGCNFEGGYSANVGIFTSQCIFDDSTRYYAPWNAVNIYMGLNATLNTIKGLVAGPQSGQPACEGIVLGSLSGDFIADNVIDLHCVSQEAGNISFTSYDGGYNKIRMRCYNATSATITGTPAATDDVDIMIHNSGGESHINNRVQRGSVSIPANSSATFTFTYPFANSPVVNFSPQAPSGNITSGVWISTISTSSVSFYNNNAVSMTLDVVAFATV